MVEVTNEAARSLGRECERIAPEVPLKRDNGEGSHASPDHTESGFSTGQSRVEEAQSWYHDHHHGRGHDDVGLISGGVPLVQIFDGCWRMSEIRFAKSSIEVIQIFHRLGGRDSDSESEGSASREA